MWDAQICWCVQRCRSTSQRLQNFLDVCKVSAFSISRIRSLWSNGNRRYDPPTNICPTLSHSVPSLSLNPLPHLLKLTTVLPAQSISIRLLSPSEAPSSPLFVVSEVVSNPNTEPVLSEACAVLIAQIGKMKRTGMGWEDKVAFLDFYREKRKWSYHNWSMELILILESSSVPIFCE